MKTRFVTLTVMLTAGLLSAGVAQATTDSVQLEYVTGGAYQTGNIKGAHTYNGVHVGVYDLKISPTGATGAGVALEGQTLQTFCMDILQTAPTSYQTYYLDSVDNAPVGSGNQSLGSVAGKVGTHRSDDLRYLFGLLEDGTGADKVDLTNSAQAAAFQAAVWEIVYETSSGAYNVTSGTLKVTGISNTALANTYLKDMHLYPEAMDLKALTNNSYQDYSLVLPGAGGQPDTVPEPLTLAGVGAAIGGVGVYIRKRKAEAPIRNLV